MNKEHQHKVLFVCMGNICRSPSAEAILLKKVQEQQLENDFYIDSCGTHGYHEGQGPDQRSIEAALNRGIDISNSIARRMKSSDFKDFLKNISSVDDHKKLSLFMEYSDDTEHIEVPDPYYGGDRGFELVLDLLDTAAEGLIRHLISKPNL